MSEQKEDVRQAMESACNHCWHPQDCQHTVGLSPWEHEDKVCCHCGAQKCEIAFRYAPELDGHGPYHPDSFSGTGTIRVREDEGS